MHVESLRMRVKTTRSMVRLQCLERVVITLVSVIKLLSCVKTHSVCGSRTLHVEINFVRVEITLVRVLITFVC
jgi:hypothetical protein